MKRLLPLQPPAKFSASSQRMSEAAKEMMNGSMSGFSAPAQKELHSLPGVTLKKRMKTGARGMAKVGMFGMGGSDNEEEAILIKEGPVDPAIFKLPEGYQRIDQAQQFRQQMQEAQQQMQQLQGSMGK